MYNSIYNKYKPGYELEFKVSNADIFFAILQEHFDLKSQDSESKDYEEIYVIGTDTYRVGDRNITQKHPIETIFESEFKITLNEESVAKSLPKNAAFTFIRYKERQSYISKSLPNWRIDYTRVKTAANKKSVAKVEPDAELEIEFVGKDSSLKKSIESVVKIIEELHPIAKIRRILGKKSINTISQVANFPRTLTIRNLGEIAKNYLVAEKTDGERVLLIEDGKHLYGLRKPAILFEISGRKSAADKVSLFDAEYVHELDKYFVFDVLILAGNAVVERPFTERLAMIAKSDILNKQIVAKKQHAPDPDIFKTSDRVYHEKYPYHIDGLIYTSAVGGYYAPVYKWKPTSELTIDFLIRVVSETGTIKTVNLYASLLRTDMKKFGFRFEKDYGQLFPFIDQEKAHIFPYKFIPFQTAEIAESPIPILDNTIIEFKYNPTEKKEESKFRRWIPYRLRKDKTLEYLEGIKQGHYIGGPNEFKIAREQLDAIINPIPEAIIFGKEQYYATHNTQSTRDNVKLYNFNNYVKSALFKRYSPHPKGNGNINNAVMDLAAGRGGDICKHIMNNVGFLLHIDVDKDALEEAAKRYAEYKQKPNLCSVEKVRTDVRFLQVDLLDKSAAKKIEKAIGKEKQFDLISCNFAIHYFLGSAKDFDIFREIIDKFLKPGGYFFFTGLDGKAIYNAFIERKQNSLIYKKNDDIFYQINKLYKNKELKNFGQEIDVFVKKIGIKHKEYILNFEAIEKAFANKADYKMVESQSFATMLEEWRKRSELNEDERLLIFLERYMVLQKNVKL